MEENNLKGCKGWILKSYHPVPTINSTLAFFSFIGFEIYSINNFIFFNSKLFYLYYWEL